MAFRMKTLADPGYWMLLEFIIKALLDIQHPVSRIQHLPGKGNSLRNTASAC